MSKLKKGVTNIPTYKAGKAVDLPIYFEKRPYQGASGRIYPIPYTAEISDEKTDVPYETVVLENDYITTTLIPALGGKIHSALDKSNNYDFIYHNKVIKPAMVGIAGPWISGGIEFNWPQHHRPTTFMPLSYRVIEEKGRKSVVMGELDYFHHMKGMAEISVDDEHSYIKAKITVVNCTAEAHPFMWWANMAVEVNDEYKIVFPPDVEWVNDHDRRAILEWPIAKGVYHTARPYNYGEGTDIHLNSAVQVPSSFMISKGQSTMDFVCGYDSGKEAGVVTVANHHIAPGKKLWTWGNGKFGDKWCANLTDDGSKYVELMTGCYTDNQPDFTWIAPYETKTFEQYWYPVKDIGEVKKGTVDGAVNLEERNGEVFFGFYPTSLRKSVAITLTAKGKELYRAKVTCSPTTPFVKQLPVQADFADIVLSVTGENGEEILSYQTPVRGTKKPIEPRKPAKKPSDIESLEELYLNGIHLKQYKHFAYRAEDYFQEALKRDPLDIRSNTAMGNLYLEHGEYDKAIACYDNAIQRATLRNCNPYDTEPQYKKALCEFMTGKLDKAYDDAYLCIWSYPFRSAGYVLLAQIEAVKGNKAQAAEFLRLSLKTNADNPVAIYMLGILTGEEGKAAKQAEEVDPLFFEDFRLEKDAVDFAIKYANFGMYERAMQVLAKANDGAMKFYYLAYYAHLLGKEDKAEKYIAKADACTWVGEFPSRRESVPVLAYANTPMAHYYLGCIYYGFERYADACEEWEKCVAEQEFGPAYRNLSLGYFDHLNQANKARECLEKAHALLPNDDRVFYELTQLYKALNLPVAERLAFYEKNAKLTQRRDDCTLQMSVLYTVRGEYEKAEEVLKHHRFHTYEGGEGYLTQHHAWLKFLMGKKALEKGDYQEAEKQFQGGLTFPENYGEEKNYFVNDAPIYMGLYEVAMQGGNEEKAKEYLALATSTKGAPTVHSYWQCLAYDKQSRRECKQELSEQMYAIGQGKIDNADVNDYYGVGAPAYPPFGYDIVKAHTVSGAAMKAFASLVKGEKEVAEQMKKEIANVDVADFSLYLLEQATW